MINICIMSGHEGQLRSEKKFYFTLMGGCELVRPTIAQMIADKRERARNNLHAPSPKFFLTLMGYTGLMSPTLTQEFLDLRELIDSGSFSLQDWEQTMVELTSMDRSIASFTLMGGFVECSLPSDNDEVDGLALHFHLGNISEQSLNLLQAGVGLRGAERRTIIYRALLTKVETSEPASRQIA